MAMLGNSDNSHTGNQPPADSMAQPDVFAYTHMMTHPADASMTRIPHDTTYFNGMGAVNSSARAYDTRRDSVFMLAANRRGSSAWIASTHHSLYLNERRLTLLGGQLKSIALDTIENFYERFSNVEAVYRIDPMLTLDYDMSIRVQEDWFKNCRMIPKSKANTRI